MSAAAILRMPSLESCGRQLRGKLASTPHPVQVDKPSNWVLVGPFAPRNPAGRPVLSVLGGSLGGRRRGRARYLWFELDGTIFTDSG